MTVNLETLLKAQAAAQPASHHPDYTAYKLAIVMREVQTRFARAFRRSFYEGEIVIAEQTTDRKVTAWLMANRCAVVLSSRDVVWITDGTLRAAGTLAQMLEGGKGA